MFYLNFIFTSYAYKYKILYIEFYLLNKLNIVMYRLKNIVSGLVIFDVFGTPSSDIQMIYLGFVVSAVYI